MKKLALLILGLILINTVITAQKKDEPKYGQDSVQCVRSLSLYSGFYRQKNYDDAITPWRATVEICPASNKNIYIHGASMYKRIFRSEKDPVVKEQYIDSLMRLYDRRIEYFGKRDYVLGRKGADLFKLDNERYEEAYNILNASVEGRGNKSEVNTLNYWMQTAVLKFKADSNERETVVNNYSKAMDILNYQRSTQKNPKKLEKINNTITNIEEIFAKSRAPGCESLVALFQPKFEAAPEDIDLLKKITMLLDKYECNDSELFVKASENLYRLEPSAESAYMVAKLYLKKADFDKASGYYKEAIEQQTDSLVLAKLYYELALLSHAKGGMAETARSYAYKAIAHNSNKGNPYLLIGKIYAGESKKCGTKEFEKKCVYLVAVDKFIKAKAIDPEIADEANGLIMTYKPYFPGKEEAFFEGFNEGDPFEVKCWINEKTKIRFP